MKKISQTHLPQVLQDTPPKPATPTFHIAPHISNKAISFDKKVSITLEYGSNPYNSYIRYSAVDNDDIVLAFENHHNGACTIILSSEITLTKKTIPDLQDALRVLGIQNITFDHR